MNQLSVEAIKKFNVNELKSELAKRGLVVQEKKEELFHTFIAKGCSKARYFKHLSKQLFRSQ